MEFLFVATDANPLRDGGDGHPGLPFDALRAGRPLCAPVNPRAQCRDLLRPQRLSFASRRHLHVLDKAGDIENQFAMAAVAGNNIVVIVLTPSQRGLAIIQSEPAFWPFRTVTTEAQVFKNRFDITIIFHRPGGRRRQFAQVHIDGRESGQCDCVGDHATGKSQHTTHKS